MKYIDIVVQSILFLFALGVLIFTFGDSDWPWAILVAQMLLGPWQLMGSLASILLKTKHYKWKIPHQVLSWLVLAGLCISGIREATFLVGLLLLGAPWALAIYYYAVSWKVLLANRAQGKFLPHLSF